MAATNEQFKRDSAALGVLEKNNDAMLAIPANALDSVAAREAVQTDLNIFNMIENGDYRYFAALAMGDSAKHQTAYQVELQHQNPAVANEADMAYTENERRMTSKENRKATEFYRMASEARAKGAQNWTPEEAELQAQLDFSIYTISDDETERGFIFDSFVLNCSLNQVFKTALEKIAPTVAQEVQEAQGVAMTSMPGKTMICNCAPGAAGAEIVNEDGSRICFGNKESIALFAFECKLSNEDVQTLVRLDARANKYRELKNIS